jgi:RHS repeat-associated protein
MESSRSSQEEPVFGRSGAGNELAASRYATPSGWQNASVGAQVSRLGSLSGNMVGPNTLQKVMAGDQMSATVQYFFESAPGNSTPLTTMLLNTLGQLLSTGSQVGGLVKGNASAVTSQLSGNPGFVNAVNPAQGGTNTPQAYLTMVFFDERFEPIAEADGGVVRQQVAQSVGSGGSTLGLGNIKAPRNGYVLVYVSNSSEQPVYFDNLQVGKVNGNILEENHYYSFGLRISAISSRRFTDQYQGKVPNAYLYNGKELMDEDADLGWLEYGFRFYDPQIGRFQQIDPMADELSSYSPYHYAYNDPVGLIDFMGLAGIDPGAVWNIIKNTQYAMYKPLQEIVVTGVIKKASNVNRTIAAIRLVGATTEMVAGATIGLLTSWTGIGAVVGAAAVVHGADQFSAALMQLTTGKTTQSFTEQGIQGGLEIAGVSKENARTIAPYADAGVSIALSGGAGATRLGVINQKSVERAITFGSSKLTTTDLVKNLGKGFRSFDAFKRAFGSAGNGQAWHHIVEQTPGNVARFGNQMIHNTENLIKLPHGSGTIHNQVSAYYSSIQGFTNGQTVRSWLSTKSFDEQFEFGIDVLKKFGWTF